VVALVLAYYVLLRSILRSQPELRRCLTRCRHCRIFFLTHPRNAGRCDLRCPFGCREAHGKDQSNRRSVAYYQEEDHKEKKRALNAKRRKRVAAPTAPEPVPTASEPTPAIRSPPPWPRSIVDYLCMVLGLIERRRVSMMEILEMLARTVRQHSMVRQRRIDQTVASLHEQPP
jgi:hypothetical protein